MTPDRDELVLALCRSRHDLDPALLAALVNRVCAGNGQDSGARYVLLTTQPVTAEQAHRLADTFTGDYPGVAALRLLRTRTDDQLIDWLGTDPHRWAATAGFFATASTSPTLLRHLGAHAPDLRVAVSAALSAHAPDDVLPAVTARVVAGTARPEFDKALRELLFHQGPAAAAVIAAAPKVPPVVWQMLSYQSWLDGVPLRQVVRRWLAPTVRRAVTARDITTQDQLASTTSALLPRCAPDDLDRLWQAWTAAAVASAAGRRVLDQLRATRSAARGTGDAPAASLFAAPQDTPDEQWRAFLTHAETLCRGRVTLWDTVLRLADGFTGTVDDLLTATAAIHTPPPGPPH